MGIDHAFVIPIKGHLATVWGGFDEPTFAEVSLPPFGDGRVAMSFTMFTTHPSKPLRQCAVEPGCEGRAVGLKTPTCSVFRKKERQGITCRN